MSELEDDLALAIKAAGLPEPERGYKFGAGRRHLDFAWPERKLAAEVQGGSWSGGRHVRGKGYEDDCIKLNLAQDMGWKVYWFTGAMVCDGRALDTITRALEARKE